MCGPPGDESDGRKCVYLVNMRERTKKAWATFLLVNTFVCALGGVVGEVVVVVTGGESVRRERVTLSVSKTTLKGKNTATTAINSE